MARPRRTKAEITAEILEQAAIYTKARTDWEGPRREMKKTALRTMARLCRQLCEAHGHLLFTEETTGFKLTGKCGVCDPSGDNKREGEIEDTTKRRQNSKQKQEAIERAKKMQAPIGKEEELSEDEYESMADNYAKSKKIEGE